jgi:hypothetical protein
MSTLSRGAATAEHRDIRTLAGAAATFAVLTAFQIIDVGRLQKRTVLRECVNSTACHILTFDTTQTDFHSMA